jgi:hypothetical protein
MSNVIAFKPAAERPRTWVRLADRGPRSRGARYVLSRTLPDGSAHPRDEYFDDEREARWCAEAAAGILGYPLLHMRGGRDD